MESRTQNAGCFLNGEIYVHMASIAETGSGNHGRAQAVRSAGNAQINAHIVQKKC